MSLFGFVVEIDKFWRWTDRCNESLSNTL